MIDKYTLDDVEFYKEDNEWYMNLKYIIENDNEVASWCIPKVAIGLKVDAIPTITTAHLDGYNKECLLTVGHKSFSVYRGDIHDLKLGSYRNILYLKRIVKEKTHKMTVAEIEKKLGYKIEIVSED